MKKTMKFFAVFALCFSVLANCLPVYAAAPSSVTCTNCGKTAYYSGSERKSATKIGEHDVVASATGLWTICYVYKVSYLDMYRCGCGVPTYVSRTEDSEHSVVHNSAYN